MRTAPTVAEAHAVSEIVPLLGGLVKDALGNCVPLSDNAPIARVETVVPNLDPLAWLDCQSSCPKFYWAGRDDECEIAALGTADSIRTGRCGRPQADARSNQESDTDRAPLPRATTAACVCDLADSATSSAKLWRHLPSAWFFLPRFELIRDRERTILACNLLPDHDTADCDRILSELARLKFDCSPLSHEQPVVLSHTELPNRRSWTRLMATLLDSIKRGDFAKAVLARQTTLDFSNALPGGEISCSAYDRQHMDATASGLPLPMAVLSWGHPGAASTIERGTIC